MDFWFWDNWVLMAMLSPFLWSICCVTDVCLISEDIYKQPCDGAIVSGLFSLLPLFFLTGELPGLAEIELTTVSISLLAGAFYFLHVLFYFKALFVLNDGSGAETFINLSVVFVPLFAFILLGERLEPIYYLGIALAIVGALLLTRYHFSVLNRKAAGLLSLSVIAVSISMVLQAQVLETVSYSSGVAMFCVGSFLLALAFMLIKRGRIKHIAGLVKRFAILFVVIEGLELGGVLSSQRATAVGPSVSFVAVIECCLPIFIMLLSLALITCRRFLKIITTDVRDTLLLQLESAPIKLVSLGLIVAAVGVVQANVI